MTLKKLHKALLIPNDTYSYLSSENVAKMQNSSSYVNSWISEDLQPS